MLRTRSSQDPAVQRTLSCSKIRKGVTESSGQGRISGGRREVLSPRASTRLCAKGTGQTLGLKDGKIMAKRCFHDRFWCWCTRQRGRVRLKEQCSDLWSTAGPLVKLKIIKRRLSHADAKLEILQAHQQAG